MRARDDNGGGGRPKARAKITGQQLLDIINNNNSTKFNVMPYKGPGGSQSAANTLLYRGPNGGGPNGVEMLYQGTGNKALDNLSSGPKKSTPHVSAAPDVSHSAPGNPGMPDAAAAIPPSITDNFKATYGGPSAHDMASKEFKPQYDLLNQLSGQAKTKYNAAGKNVGGMYDALAKAMRGEETAIKADYGANSSAVGNAYNNAIKSVKDNQTNSNNDVAAIARRLGVSEAVPAANQDGNNQAALLQGLMQSNKANSMSTSQQLGQNEVDYNRNSADTTQMAGINARSDFQSKLMDVLGGYDNKRLEVKANQGQAENKYGLSIADMIQQAQLAHDKIAATSQSDAASAAAKAQQDASANEFKQAQLGIQQGQLDLANDQFKYKASHPAAAKTSNMDPYEKLASTASYLYHGNDVAAANARKAVTDTLSRGYNGNTNFATVQDFIKAVLGRNPGAHDADQLAQLAATFYSGLKLK